MRIAYLARCDASSESGVLKKLVSQIETWRGNGHEAALFLHSRTSGVWPAARPIVEAVVKDTGWVSRGFRLASLTGAIEGWKPDIVYARFDTGSRALARMMTRVPTVLELNTDDLNEYPRYLPGYQMRYHLMVRGSVLRKAAGFVAVTNEIADRFASFERPSVVIANGIVLADYSPLPPSAHDGLRVVFMGAPGASWHGVDKIAELARRAPGIQFDLIGPAASVEYPSNVVAHGTLSRGEYTRILSNAHAAIGTLAMHRNGMNEGSTLKVREYLALGLPCVIGYSDTDFPEPVPFLLQLPNTEDNAAMAVDRIEEFCRSWQGRRVDRSEILHIDSQVKEVERLKFIAQVLQRATAR